MRTRALGASLWMDEGLSIGIASQPFFDIPGVLKQDGAPPLYYLLLHVWMQLFGDGPVRHPGPVGGHLADRRARRPVGRLDAVQPPRRA